MFYGTKEAFLLTSCPHCIKKNFSQLFVRGWSIKKKQFNEERCLQIQDTDIFLLLLLLKIIDIVFWEKPVNYMRRNSL